MNRIVLNIKMLPRCDWLKGFGRIKTKTQSREWRYEATWTSLRLNVIKHPFMLSQKRVRSKCAWEGWGTDLPAFRLRVAACMVGVKKRVGGGRGEVKKGEELGREGKGWRRSFFIFPFALFSSPSSHFFAHHTGCHRLRGCCGAFNSLSLPYWEFERPFGTWRMTANNWRVRHHWKGRNGKRSCHLSYFLYLPAISHVEIYIMRYRFGYEVADPADSLQTTLSIIWRLENFFKLLASRANWNLGRAFFHF